MTGPRTSGGSTASKDVLELRRKEKLTLFVATRIQPVCEGERCAGGGAGGGGGGWGDGNGDGDDEDDPEAAPTLGDVLALLQRRGGVEETREAAGRAVMDADQGELEGEGRTRRMDALGRVLDAGGGEL